MLTTNEQTELDTLLTVEEPNDWMKDRIKELKEKQLSKEPLNQGEEECDCLACKISKTNSPNEQVSIIGKYLMSGKSNIIDDIKYNSELSDEGFDLFCTELCINEHTDLMWLSDSYKKFKSLAELDKYKSDNEFILNEVENNKDLFILKSSFTEYMLKDLISIFSMCTSKLSFHAVYAYATIKNTCLFIIKTAKLLDISFTNPALINLCLVNAVDFLRSNVNKYIMVLDKKLNDGLGEL